MRNKVSIKESKLFVSCDIGVINVVIFRKVDQRKHIKIDNIKITLRVIEHA